MTGTIFTLIFIVLAVVGVVYVFWETRRIYNIFMQQAQKRGGIVIKKFFTYPELIFQHKNHLVSVRVLHDSEESIAETSVKIFFPQCADCPQLSIRRKTFQAKIQDWWENAPKLLIGEPRFADKFVAKCTDEKFFHRIFDSATLQSFLSLQEKMHTSQIILNFARFKIPQVPDTPQTEFYGIFATEQQSDEEKLSVALEVCVDKIMNYPENYDSLINVALEVADRFIANA